MIRDQHLADVERYVAATFGLTELVAQAMANVLRGFADTEDGRRADHFEFLCDQHGTGTWRLKWDSDYRHFRIAYYGRSSAGQARADRLTEHLAIIADSHRTVPHRGWLARLIRHRQEARR